MSSERRAGAAEGLLARRVGASGSSGGAAGSLRCFGDSGNARVAVGASITRAGAGAFDPRGFGVDATECRSAGSDAMTDVVEAGGRAAPINEAFMKVVAP